MNTTDFFEFLGEQLGVTKNKARYMLLRACFSTHNHLSSTLPIWLEFRIKKNQGFKELNKKEQLYIDELVSYCRPFLEYAEEFFNIPIMINDINTFKEIKDWFDEDDFVGIFEDLTVEGSNVDRLIYVQIEKRESNDDRIGKMRINPTGLYSKYRLVDIAKNIDRFRLVN